MADFAISGMEEGLDFEETGGLAGTGTFFDPAGTTAVLTDSVLILLI